MSKDPIEGEDFHKHPEFGNEAHRFEGAPFLGNLSGRILGLNLLPQPFGLALFRIQNPGHPQVPAATRAWFVDAQRVLQHAARDRLTTSEAKRNAFLDVEGLSRERS